MEIQPRELIAQVLKTFDADSSAEDNRKKVDEKVDFDVPALDDGVS